MNILVTNDDGIDADGLRRLAEAAKKYGQVWVIAPDGQRSAASHSITLRETIDVIPVPDYPVAGVKAYKTTGSPADCVRFGILNVVEGKTDLVISGINFGWNAGSDTQYSATVGAAMEAACNDIPAIAVSEGLNGVHEVTDAYLEEMLDELVAQPIYGNQIWNLNFPGCKLSEYKGVLRDRVVARNAFYKDHYTEEELPNGGKRLRVYGNLRYDAAEGTDFKAILDNYISIGKVRNLATGE